MPGIKAGTAYVALQLSQVSSLKKQMADAAVGGAEAAGAKASKALGDKIDASPAAAKVRTSFMAGIKSLGDVSAASIVSSFRSGMSSLPGMMRSVVSSMGSGVASMISALGSSLGAIPGLLVSAGTHLRHFASAVGQLAYQFQFAGILMTAAFTAPLAGIGIAGAAIGIKFASQVEDAMVALKALLPAGYDVAALIKRLQQLAIASPVFDSAAVITFTQRMVAAGVEVGKTERFIKAFGNIAVTGGASMDKVTRALEAFAQMAGKGKVQMEELRQQLGDALPSAMKIAAEGLGVTQERLFEMVSDGEVTADRLMNAFIKVGESKTYLAGASAGATTLRSKWNALKETIQTSLGSAVLGNMDAIKKSFDDLTPMIQKVIGYMVANTPKAVEALGKFVGKLAELKKWYEDLAPDQQDMVKKMALIAAIAGPVVAVLGGLGTIIAAVAGAFSILLSPVGLTIIGILAVVGAGIALYKWLTNLYDKSEAFRNAIQTLVDTFNKYLKPTIMDTVNSIKESVLKAWDQMREAFGRMSVDWEGLKYLLKALGVIILAVLAIIVGVAIGMINGIARAIGPIIQGIVSLFTGIAQIVVGILNFIYAFATGNWKAMDAALLTIWNGLWDAVVGTLVNLVRAVWGLISGFVEGIVGFFQSLYDILVGHSIIPDMVNAIISWFRQLPAVIFGIIMGFVSWVVGKFSELASMVVNFVRSLVSSAVSKFQELRSAFSGIVSGLVDQVGNMLSYVAGLPGRILNTLGNLGALLYQKGRDVIQGLANGISSMAGEVAGRARAIADSVKDTIAGALKTRSPSRVMMEIGKHVVSGLVIGISNDLQDIRAISARAAAAVTQPIAMGGSASLTAVSPEAARSQASLYIENYTAPRDSDPSRVAEDFAWINRTRGWA